MPWCMTPDFKNAFTRAAAQLVPAARGGGEWLNAAAYRRA